MAAFNAPNSRLEPGNKAFRWLAETNELAERVMASNTAPPQPSSD